MLKNLVKKSRSYRGYEQSRKISREELLDFVDCARYTPSSVNRQPFRYYLAYDQEQLDRIQPLTGWAAMLPERKLPDPDKRPTAFIVICQETEWVEDLTACLCDVGIVAQTILLAATDAGLGGIMIGNFSAAKLQEALELPEHLVPMLILAIGKPDERIVLTEVGNGESLRYYRDAQDIHYVPKRKLEDIVI